MAERFEKEQLMKSEKLTSDSSVGLERFLVLSVLPGCVEEEFDVGSFAGCCLNLMSAIRNIFSSLFEPRRGRGRRPPAC